MKVLGSITGPGNARQEEEEDEEEEEGVRGSAVTFNFFFLLDGIS